MTVTITILDNFKRSVASGGYGVPLHVEVQPETIGPLTVRAADEGGEYHGINAVEEARREAKDIAARVRSWGHEAEIIS